MLYFQAFIYIFKGKQFENVNILKTVIELMQKLYGMTFTDCNICH